MTSSLSTHIHPAILPGDSGQDGGYLAGPVYDEETILMAELDLTEIDREQMTLDVSGHYARPDIFEFRVNRR